MDAKWITTKRLNLQQVCFCCFPLVFWITCFLLQKITCSTLKQVQRRTRMWPKCLPTLWVSLHCMIPPPPNSQPITQHAHHNTITTPHHNTTINTIQYTAHLNTQHTHSLLCRGYSRGEGAGPVARYIPQCLLKSTAPITTAKEEKEHHEKEKGEKGRQEERCCCQWAELIKK